MSLDFAAEAAERFVPLARRFCAWVELRAKMPIEDGDLHDLHAILAELQAAAARIPNAYQGSGEGVAADGKAAATGTSDAAEDKRARDFGAGIAEHLPLHEYRKFYNPFAGSDGENVTDCTLDDDLSDIYRDLRAGLGLYEAGKQAEAVRQWRSSYWTHWGHHVTGAQAALWAHLAEGGGYLG